MAGTRVPGPNCLTRGTPQIDAGTLTRSKSPQPKSIGCNAVSKSKQRVKVLVFDGAKVKEFLFHVAVSEVQWQDLLKDPQADVPRLVQEHRARDRASVLYDDFLDASSKGPTSATTFLANQHDRQKKFSLESQKIYQELSAEIANRNKLLSEAAFGAQAVKSAATVSMAIIGMFLTGPAILAGAGIALGYDVVIEGINHLGPSNETNANAVVVGFKQTAANDVVDVAGSARQVMLEENASVLQKTLSYPMKSSTFRSAISEAGQIDKLLKTLGWLSLGVTLYQEGYASYSSYKEMNSQ